MTSIAPAPVRSGRGRFTALTVARVDRLCDGAVAITLQVPEELAERFRFRPGQSLTLRRELAGRFEHRSYSICSAAGEPLRIGVREVAGGLLSGWLVRRVRVGDRIEVAPPAGAFGPERISGGRHVLIAAGSGITPVLSIATSLLRHPEAQVTLVYGNRRADTVMFAEELADLKDLCTDRLALVHVLSREAQEVELFSGRLDAARLRRLLPAMGDPRLVEHWWLCGPFGMIEAAQEVLAELGVPRERVHRELFYVEPEPPRHCEQAEPVDPRASQVTVLLDGRASTVEVSPGTALLDGLQRVRPDVPFSCKGGVCGTCRARLVSGEVRMRRNFALEAAELAAGFVLTCQAVPMSPQVSVDFDA